MSKQKDPLVFTGAQIRESQKGRLDALAKRQDRSLSYLIRRAVESYLNRQTVNQKMEDDR